MDGCSLKSLHHNECVEVAFLAALEIVLQVEVQSRPVSVVRVEIERESMRKSTDVGGRCFMMLRPGRRVLRLFNKGLIVHSFEQEVVVTQSRPCIVVSLPITPRTWRPPTVIGGGPRTYRVWLSVIGSWGNDSWEPRRMVRSCMTERLSPPRERGSSSYRWKPCNPSR